MSTGRRLADMSPKALTGEELDLDDAPAREAELFLVDGNNLAYRAYFALPEELATSEGFPTGALLGFTNMLFKLLSDYRPKGVAVAWDTRPVHRAAISEEYKSERRPMPDLLREQFPHFRPIVEAFGYRNLEFEGWEADDVIATLATQADAAGVRTCVVSTDRDAFQLVTDNVVLMMTPRGVQEVNVYTPARVEARLGVPPEKVPDLIGLKGDTSDNIPGIPGIGDKTAAELMIRYGSLEGVLEHASELSPARAKNVAAHADQARASKVLATMRRDLELGCDPATLVLAPPDRSELREIFRRFEFRGLLSRVDLLDEALPAAEPVRAVGEELPWREGEPSNTVLQGRVGFATDGERTAVATEAEVVILAERPSNTVLQGAELVVHDAKALRVDACDDTLIAAYLIEPGRAAYELDDLGRRVRRRDPADARGRGGDRRARPPCGDSAPPRAAHARAPRRARQRRAVRANRAASDPRAGGNGGRRRPHRHVPDGRDHRAPPGAGRGARGGGVRPRRRGVHARLDAAGGADPVREARADARS